MPKVTYKKNQNQNLHRLSYLFIILLTLSICFLPSLTRFYVHHDDIYFWARSANTFEKFPMFDLMFAMGRFLGAYIITALNWIVFSVKDLNIIRLLSVGQLALSAWIVFLYLSRYIQSTFKAYLICIIIFTLPPFQIITAYASLGFLSTSILLSTLSAYLALQIPIDKPLFKRLIDIKVFLAILFLISSYAVYASTAPFYWAITALMIVTCPKNSYYNLRQLVWNLFYVGLTATAGYSLILKLVKKMFEWHVHGIYTPYILSTNYNFKLRWFLKEPLINAFSLWDIYPHHFLPMAIAAFILCPFIWCQFIAEREFKEKKADHVIVRRSFFKIFILSLTFILSFLPNLLSIVNVAYYRCSAGLISIMAILFIWSGNKWTKLFPQSSQNSLHTTFLIIICLYGGFKSFNNIQNTIVLPNHKELQIAIQKIEQANPNNYDAIHVFHPDRNRINQRYDEFGNLTICYGQDIRLFIKSVFRELNREKEFNEKNLIISNGPMDKNYNSNGRTLIIDMTKTFNPKGDFGYLFK